LEGDPPADGLDELPLDGDMVELDPLGGTVVELEERGVDAPWSLPLFPELLLDPELSQATSDSAERRAAAISHFLSIMRLHPAFVVHIRVDAITGGQKKKFRAPNFLTSRQLCFARTGFTARG
jgi:hypothetical protein